MAMDFWEAQRRARKQTLIYMTLFVVLTLATALFAEMMLRHFAPESYDSSIPLMGLGFLGVTVAVALYNYAMYRSQGGGYVAESIGARRANPNSPDSRERQLINIVQEMAIATTLPMPRVYIIPSNEINAFAAGVTQDRTAIAITEGALIKLNRDEIQGVIAHEFGHIAHQDMMVSLRLAAMVMGFFFVIYLGFRLLQVTSYRRRDGNGKGNPAMIAALVFIAAGALTWFMGSILKASVSRQCEYRADASAVQYTRNPSGIANALKKIAKDTSHDMPKQGSAYSHMYLEDHSSIFATHPPIQKRIAAIEAL